MFKTLKSKILSCLVIIGALTQTAKAQESFSHDTSNETKVSNTIKFDVLGKRISIPKPKSDYAWPIGVGILTLGALVTMKKSCEYTDSEELRKYYLMDDQAPLPENKPVATQTPAKTAPTPTSATKTPQNTTANWVKAQPTFDPLAIRPIAHENNMSREERDLLATRLHAARRMEDITHERASLTRQMTKAKKANDTAAIQAITARRKELSVLRKESYTVVAGPLLPAIKEERRMLAKKMAQAHRRQDTACKAEINKRRRMLNTQEELLKLTVRDFKYKAERHTFLKKKTPLPMAQIVADRYRMVA